MTSALGEKGKTMADEYINKKDVINLGVLMQTHLWTREQTYNAIFCLPTADVAPVRHAMWIEYGENKDGTHNMRCSKCGAGIKSKGHANSYYTKHKYRYCRNCGARMDGDGNEID